MSIRFLFNSNIFKIKYFLFVLNLQLTKQRQGGALQEKLTEQKLFYD